MTKEFDGIEWTIFQILGENIVFPEIDPNADIYYKPFGGQPTRVGACLSYQDMSWIDGTKDMFFIPLMATRTLAFGLSFLIGTLAVLGQILKISYYTHCEKDELLEKNQYKN